MTSTLRTTHLRPLTRRLAPLAVALTAAWAATGCGGGDDGTGAFAERLAQVVPPAEGRARALAVTIDNTAPTVGDLFAWAQWKWPDLFPAGAAEVDRDIGGEIYRIRVYASGIFLAVGTTNRGVFALLPIPGSDVISLGVIDNFTPEITAATCSFNPQAAGCTPGGGGGGGGGTAGYNACVDPAAQNLPVGFTTRIVFQYEGTLGGEQTVESTIVGPGTFQGQSLVRIDSKTSGTNVVQGITQTTTTEVSTYSRVAGGLVETLGATAKVTVGGGTFMGFPLPSTTTETRTVNNPAITNREFTLQVGQSVTQTSNTTTTVLSGFGVGTVTPATVTTTHTYEARETITVLGKTYDTCRYRISSPDSPGFSTTWFIVGKGIPARTTSDGQSILLKSGTYNGAPL